VSDVDSLSRWRERVRVRVGETGTRPRKAKPGSPHPSPLPEAEGVRRYAERAYAKKMVKYASSPMNTGITSY
jgi:hypothetical protein